MENTVIGLIHEAKKLCPVFFPSVFPQSFNPRCLNDLFSVSLREIDSREEQPSEDSFQLSACFSTEFLFTSKEITITEIKVHNVYQYVQFYFLLKNLIAPILDNQ